MQLRDTAQLDHEYSHDTRQAMHEYSHTPAKEP